MFVCIVGFVIAEINKLDYISSLHMGPHVTNVVEEKNIKNTDNFIYFLQHHNSIICLKHTKFFLKIYAELAACD